jgi:hypothetical protein
LLLGFILVLCGLFRQVDNEKHWKNQHWHVQLMLSEQVLARWWHPVASIEALDLLHWAMHGSLYRRIAMAIKLAGFAGVFVDSCLFACCPGGCWGDTEQVVAQCQCPVASKVALDMPHWAMPSVLLRRTPWPSKCPADEVHLFIIVDFVITNNRS